MKWQRVFPVPSFAVAYGISFAAMLTFAVWFIVDSTFPQVREIIRIDLGNDPEPGVKEELLWMEHDWDHLGPRLALFMVLTGAAVLSNLTLVCRLFLGNSCDRSLRSYLLATTLTGLWLALFVSSGQLDSLGLRYRLWNAMPGIKQDADALLSRWPTADGTLPFSGDFRLDPPNRHILMCRGNGGMYPLRQYVSGFIRQLDNGGLSFDLRGAPFGRVEYHPNGATPNSFTESYFDEDGAVAFQIRQSVLSYHTLDPNWYLVWYDTEMVETTPATNPNAEMPADNR